ncbi:DUF4190 domain-containing protein [Streptomyces sp. TRM64462]|uniref:DUF4190 domain-containing protein n=1 Tax=Streptomyces sp. TRM64462 TaxID=2741726 RepID=UPI0015860725|nr:DUF4190 domain-containing protein [Streptomyces sp. TRM64462]
MSSSPQGYPVPQPPARTSGLAVASLVTGIVCCVPPLGLILGAVALGRIKRERQRGKGLAVAGMVLSAVSTVLVAAGFATGAFQKVIDEAKEVTDEVASSSSAFSLRTGDCFNQPGGTVEEQEVELVKSVKCAEPHDAEVTGAFQLKGDTYPPVKEIEKQAEARCSTIGEAYAMDTWAVPQNAVTFYYHPTEESWRTLRDRTVTCAFAADKGKLTGSLRSDAKTLTKDQLAFLKAVNPIDTALYEQPEADPDADLAANTKWAAEVEKAVGGAIAGLQGHTYPGASAKPVADLVKQLESARKHWAKAADAADPDAYWEHYDVAFDAIPNDLGKDARAALNLASTPPVVPAS